MGQQWLVCVSMFIGILGDGARKMRLDIGLAVYLFQACVNGHPLNMLVEKYIGLGLAVYWIVHASQRDM